MKTSAVILTPWSRKISSLLKFQPTAPQPKWGWQIRVRLRYGYRRVAWFRPPGGCEGPRLDPA